MSEPDNPRWLEEIATELRREPAVRPSWRAHLLADIVHAGRPLAGDVTDDRFDAPNDTTASPSRRRSIVLSPVAGIAAALLFALLGGALTYVTISARASRVASTTASHGSATPVSTPAAFRKPGSAEREVVHFELSAPRASRVSLVGSFNAWNPQATPLVRDSATGKWTVSVKLPPGRHVYAFVVDGDVTADPTAPLAADDDFGSTNSVVFVAAPRT